LDFLDSTGKVIRSYSSKQDSSAAQPAAPAGEDFFGPAPASRVPNKRGVNTFLWNMRYPDATNFPGMILWAANVTGPLVQPGTYKVRMLVGGKPVATEAFRILPDPRSKATLAEGQGQTPPARLGRAWFARRDRRVKTHR